MSSSDHDAAAAMWRDYNDCKTAENVKSTARKYGKSSVNNVNQRMKKSKERAAAGVISNKGKQLVLAQPVRIFCALRKCCDLISPRLRDSLSQMHANH